MWTEYNRKGAAKIKGEKKNTSKEGSDHKDVNSLIMCQVNFIHSIWYYSYNNPKN